MLKRTPLFETHQKLGGRLIEFGGWEMPVQYSGILEEHRAVRTAAGLFDISHMGELRLSGAAALEFLNRVLTNDVQRLGVGQGQYTLMCRETGGVVDDLYVFRTTEQEYLLIVNASRIEADMAWLEAQWVRFSRRGDVVVVNESDQYGAVAIQGPRVAEFIDACFDGGGGGGAAVTHARDLQKNEIASFRTAPAVAWVSRTGYTGEDGFEVVVPAEQVAIVWDRILTVGQPFGLKPAGLGARDTLRLEACYPLYGHELAETITPLEAGLGFFVALDKPDFMGRPVLAAQKQHGFDKQCIAFKMAGKSAPPRPHYAIWTPAPSARKIGEVVSGTQSPTLGVGIGMGYVPPAEAKPGTVIDIEIRGRMTPATVVTKPFYRRKV